MDNTEIKRLFSVYRSIYVVQRKALVPESTVNSEPTSNPLELAVHEEHRQTILGKTGQSTRRF